MNYSKRQAKKQRERNIFNVTNPQLEDMLDSKQVAITLNHAETFPRLEPWIEAYAYKIKKYILPYFDIDFLNFELSSSGRLHLHGILNVRTLVEDTINWYMGGFAEVRGINIKIEKLTNKEDWIKYCTKQKSFHDYMKTKDLPHTLTKEDVEKLAKDPPTIIDQFHFMA